MHYSSIFTGIANKFYNIKQSNNENAAKSDASNSLSTEIATSAAALSTNNEDSSYSLTHEPMAMGNQQQRGSVPLNQFDLTSSGDGDDAYPNFPAENDTDSGLKENGTNAYTVFT